MYLSRNAILLAGLSTVASAWQAASYSGLSVKWQDSFEGGSGSLPSSKWRIVGPELHVNNERQSYQVSNRNVQLSGGGTLQLIPWKDGGSYSSGRIETKDSFTPADGKITRVEARIRMGPGDSNRKQGIWPAFWMLGDSMRHGTPWPACGEIDILENINGQSRVLGTTHCDTRPGGVCNEDTGISASTDFSDASNWNTFAVEWNRRPGNWRDETIKWYKNGNEFHSVSGGRINNEGVWNTLAHSAQYIILNVAVGGNWPGDPNDQTVFGWDSMMEVAYVAQYEG